MGPPDDYQKQPQQRQSFANRVVELPLGYCKNEVDRNLFDSGWLTVIADSIGFRLDMTTTF